jgi:hypothetical protein
MFDLFAADFNMHGKQEQPPYGENSLIKAKRPGGNFLPPGRRWLKTR